MISGPQLHRAIHYLTALSRCARSFFTSSPDLTATGVLLACSLVLFACASSKLREGAPEAETSTQQPDSKRSPRGAPSVTAMDKGRADGQTSGGESDEVSEGEESSEGTETEEPAANRMIVYQGQMEIRVISPVESLRNAGALVAKLGGTIEKSDFYEGGRRVIIVLRVPVAKFFEAMDLLPGLGSVLSRSLSAEDVTKEFADVESKLRSTRLLKERLEKLLESVKSVDEKVKILREINRLATVIETLAARSKYLADRASLSTITLTLVAESATDNAPDRVSPFSWIRSLDPGRRSIERVSGLDLKRPDGFFDNSVAYRNGDPNLFFSADGSALRAGQLKNRPAGDAAFWRQALSIEFKRRAYREIKSLPLTNGQAWVFQIHDGLNVYYYGVSFVLRGQDLHVIEAFIPGEAAFKQDGEKVQRFLGSLSGGGQ